MACKRCGYPKYGNGPYDFYPHCSYCITCPDCRGTGMDITAVGKAPCKHPVCRGRGFYRQEEKKLYDEIEKRKREGFKSRV